MVAALFRAGFRRQSLYRLAWLNGLATNVFFGAVQTALFLALYRQRGEVGGLDEAEALTYVWLRQAIFPLTWNATWIYELPSRIRSGEWAVELTRPGHALVRHFAFDLGRAAFLLVVRCSWPVFAAGLVLDLDVPTEPLGLAALAASMSLVAVIGSQIRFLIGATAFWTPDYRGVYSLAFAPLYLISGFIVPVEFLPAAIETVARSSPLSAILVAPLEVATGHPAALVLQVAWVAALAAASRAVSSSAVRTTVIAGG